MTRRLQSHGVRSVCAMPPKGSKRALPSVTDAIASKLSFITSFFGRPAVQLADADIPAKKRGRPKALEKSGRPEHSGLQATAYTLAATLLVLMAHCHRLLAMSRDR